MSQCVLTWGTVWQWVCCWAGIQPVIQGSMLFTFPHLKVVMIIYRKKSVEYEKQFETGPFILMQLLEVIDHFFSVQFLVHQVTSQLNSRFSRLNAPLEDSIQESSVGFSVALHSTSWERERIVSLHFHNASPPSHVISWRSVTFCVALTQGVSIMASMQVGSISTDSHHLLLSFHLIFQHTFKK